MTDPIIAELRSIRNEHSAKFNHDVEAMARDLQKKEQASRLKLVSLKPRKPPKK